MKKTLVIVLLALVSMVFADEIRNTVVNGKYDYRFPDGSLDWSTFYGRMNQYASQYRYYAVEVTDVFGEDINALSFFWSADGLLRFVYRNNKGLMITMWITNRPFRGWDGDARQFTNYNEAVKFWNNALQHL
jgi:hypothetical protein